jgi:hypothetical protein
MYVLICKILIFWAKSSDIGTNEISRYGDDPKEAILPFG